MRWWVFVFALAACAPRAVKPEPVPLQNLGRVADPPEIAAAVEFRKSDPIRALFLLREAWLVAGLKKDDRLAAFALDRAGDVVMDLGPDWNNRVPLLDESARGLMRACDTADAYYAKAWQLMEKSDDHRLLGRLAHDIAWGFERCDHDELARRWYRVALDHRLAAGDALGVRFTANNLGRLFQGPKRERLDLYLLALEGARIAGDAQGERKVHTNIARLYYFSADTRWLEVTDGGFEREYAEGPPTGEARVKFLHHLGAALAAAKVAEESSADVCRGFGIDEFDCTTWLDGTPEELFPEPRHDHH